MSGGRAHGVFSERNTLAAGRDSEYLRRGYRFHAAIRGRPAVRYGCDVRLDKLPGWVIDNDASVRAEVAPMVSASMSERWAATRACARATAAMLRFHRDPRRVLAHRDPLPESWTSLVRRLGADRE